MKSPDMTRENFPCCTGLSMSNGYTSLQVRVNARRVSRTLTPSTMELIAADSVANAVIAGNNSATTTPRHAGFSTGGDATILEDHGGREGEEGRKLARVTSRSVAPSLPASYYCDNGGDAAALDDRGNVRNHENRDRVGGVGLESADAEASTVGVRGHAAEPLFRAVAASEAAELAQKRDPLYEYKEKVR